MLTGKLQTQPHPGTVNQLPGVQIARTGQQRQPILPVHQQHLCSAARKVQRQVRAGRQAAVLQRRAHMAALMRGRKQRRLKGRRRHARKGQTGQEHRHVGGLVVPGMGGHANRIRTAAANLRQRLFIQRRKLPYMRKNGLALAKAARACLHGQKLPIGCKHAIFIRCRHRGGVAAGIDAQDNHESCFSPSSSAFCSGLEAG